MPGPLSKLLLRPGAEDKARQISRLSPSSPRVKSAERRRAQAKLNRQIVETGRKVR